MKLSLCCALLAAEVPNLRRDEGLLGPVVSLRTLLGKAAMQGVVAVIEMCCNVHLPMRWLHGSYSSLYALPIDLVAVEGNLLFALVVSLRGTEILLPAHLECHQNMIKVTIMEVKVRHCGGERALIQEVYRVAHKVDAVFGQTSQSSPSRCRTLMAWKRAWKTQLELLKKMPKKGCALRNIKTMLTHNLSVT